MTSSKKVVLQLLDDTATALGCSRKEVLEQADRVRGVLTECLKPYGFSAVHLSLYRNNRWELIALFPVGTEGVPRSEKWIGRPIDLVAFLKDCESQLCEFLADLAGEGN